MIDRIQQLMKTYQLSAADLADTLGTERSGISHFLSGRNKPSLAFITKLLEKYPEVSPDWLITGAGAMMRSDNRSVAPPVVPGIPPIVVQPVETKQIESEKILVAEVHDEDPAPYRLPKQEKPARQETKQQTSLPGITEDSDIERIVIFFNDHSFKTYKMR